MALRIAIWAAAGALVAVCLNLYIQAIFPTSLNADRPLLDLVYLICPIALVHNHAIRLYEVLVGNAATYAIVGAVVESARRYFRVRTVSH